MANCYADERDPILQGLHLELLTDRPSIPDQSEVDPDLQDKAVAWAKELEALRAAEADPIVIVWALRAYLGADWGNSRLRSHLIEPYVVGALLRLVPSEEAAAESAGLHEAFLDIAKSDLGPVSRLGRAAILSLAARSAATEEERLEVQAMIVDYGVRDEAGSIGQVLDMRFPLLSTGSPAGIAAESEEGQRKEEAD